jgi:SAM-dependent methyltransferase
MPMASATIQGQLWGARAQDWATHAEQVCLPLFGAALDAARVTSGTRLLDAGCGAGLLALLASLRGAEVTAFDASPGLLAIARQRVPAADAADVFGLLGKMTGHELRGEGRVYGGGPNKIEPSELARISASAFTDRWP